MSDEGNLNDRHMDVVRAALAARSEPRAEGLREVVDATLPEVPAGDLAGGTFQWGYRAGWNAAREAMLAATPPAPALEVVWDTLREAHQPHAYHAWSPPEQCETEPCRTLAILYAALTPERQDG